MKLPISLTYSSSLLFLRGWEGLHLLLVASFCWSLECEKGGNFGYYCDQDNTLKHKLEAFLHSLHVRGRNEAILPKVKLVKEKKVGTLHIIWSRWYSPFKYVVKNDTLVHYFVGSSSMLINGFKFAFFLIMG